ncbi:nitrous oxide reductase family maturation protein NosD [Maritimibacter sp. 55A14]|uniref:nitrous oxide reductase family maturation protein NosD n=1 Tax=Maritimibacter sp. 55A14 TaxID=2174844 RepID=UPI000D61481F|nr:nitrous oxide reductase family maturation protein NosD [Maritimibacter sp. 55A14]PWE34345.1 nitrous oxide reductase family maturation protein NosD [Maritimibacter sp. 55A14]
MPVRALCLALLLFAPGFAPAAERDVAAGGAGLAEAIREAGAGDTLRLGAGRHAGGQEISKPLTLTCAEGARIDGGGQGSVLTVTAPDVTVEGCAITGSGDSHETLDSGIRLLEGADRARVTGNRLTGNLYGVDVHGARDAMVARNVIEGRQDHRVNDRGNGVYVWNAPGSDVVGNDIRWGRDGIFVNTSRDNSFRDNQLRDLRFAVHYMYANESEVSGNVSIGNDLGFAVMYSRKVRITRNVSIRDDQHGIMLNYTNSSVVAGNLVRNGANRCLFIYNAHKNEVAGNRFEGCDIGVHFTAGSERNAMTGNAFVGNRTQVKYVGSKWLDWSHEGRGNYWSDFAAYDIDGDGIADAPYRPNDSMDHVLWSQPAAKLLLGAPAVQLVRWAQSAFPALLPGGVVDPHPLMRPVEIDEPGKGGKT